MNNPSPNESFRAFIRFADNQPAQSCDGLSFTKAHWRYHWIKREFHAGRFRNVKTYGFQSEQFQR
jgi:hypothetical protein